MEHFPAQLSLEETAAQLARFRQHWEGTASAGGRSRFRRGPVRRLGGLARPRFEAHFTPCVEIGWRFAAGVWNRGYATEGAAESLRFGWALQTPRLAEIVAFTVPGNARSRRVMEKLGMVHHPEDDFEHPRIPPGHPLRLHALYRIRRPGVPA
jgi:RimJ/RimL family protein N-acetyltransferase